VEAVAEYARLGYRAVRAQSGVPGLASTYGVGRGKMFYEPAEKDLPPENGWSSERYLNFVPRLFKRLRDEFGEDLHLLHDAQDRQPVGALSRADRIARRDRPEPGVHGGGAAFRSERAQLRDSGVHAAYARDRPRVSAPLHVRGRHDASGRRARPRRRPRRGAR